MSHLPFTLLAYFFNSLAVLTNKFLLKKTIPDPVIYIFYISLVSLLAIMALPFTRIPSLEVFTIASFSTLLWTLGAYFMFKALKSGEIARVIPVISTLVPLILLGFASQTHTITPAQTLAVWLLILGMVFLTIIGRTGSFTKQEIMFEILSAAFFAVSYILLRQAYLKLDFFSVIVWSRLILLPLSVLLLTIPVLRRKIITSSLSLSPRHSSGSIKSGLIFLGGQLSGTISELLLMFSISLANPALVNSLQGVQYIFLLIFSLILAGKYPAIFGSNHTLKAVSVKFMGIILIGMGLYLLTINSS